MIFARSAIDHVIDSGNPKVEHRHETLHGDAHSVCRPQAEQQKQQGCNARKDNLRRPGCGIVGRDRVPKNFHNLTIFSCASGHREGPALEDEYRQRGTGGKQRNDTQRYGGIEKKLLHVAHPFVSPIERLEEHDERENRLVGVDARHHRQQSRDVETGHRAADTAAEP